MEDLKHGNQSPEPNATQTKPPAEKVTDSQKNDVYDNKILKRVFKHLSKKKKRKQPSKKICADFIDPKIDLQVKLRCRQLPTVIEELRKAIMRQDWDEVATLLMILCHPGLKYYTRIIIQACFILLLSHPDSNFSLLQSFIRLTTGYVLEEDINKFIRILFALRKESLEPLECGKYIRQTGDYKVVMDPAFEKL